nr:4-14 CRISPR MLO1 [Cucumis sativus]
MNKEGEKSVENLGLNRRRLLHLLGNGESFGRSLDTTGGEDKCAASV